jgi:hypothetical protein
MWKLGSARKLLRLIYPSVKLTMPARRPLLTDLYFDREALPPTKNKDIKFGYSATWPLDQRIDRE